MYKKVMVNTYILSDSELCLRLKDGDESAFSAIYDRYWKELLLSAGKIVQNRATAQDAVQEVFIALWNRRETVELESLRSWLFQAVRFQVFKAIRHEKVNQKTIDKLAIVSNDLAGEDPIRFRELQRLIHHIIASLPEDQQEYFRMNRDQGKTYREIAEEKNISIKTVEKKISLAIKHIGSHMDDTTLMLLVLHILSSHPN